MIVTGHRPAARRPGRPQGRPHRAERARVEGRFSGRRGARLRERVAERRRRAGRRRAAGRPARHRGRPVPGLPRRRPGAGSVCADIADRAVTIHGQSEQVRLGEPDRQRELLDRVRRARSWPPPGRATGSAGPSTAARRAELETAARRGAEPGPGDRPAALRPGARSSRSRPQPGEDVALAAEAIRLQAADDLRLAAQTALLAGWPATTTSRAGRSPSVLAAPARPGPGGRPGPGAGRAGRPAWPRRATCSPTWPRTSPATSTTWTPTRPGWSGSPSAAPQLAGLTRKYGADRRRGAGLVAEARRAG